MIFIYANTTAEMIGITTRHNFLNREFDIINEDSITRLRGMEKPIVVHNGCVEPSNDFVQTVYARNGILLPLMCGHVTHT